MLYPIQNVQYPELLIIYFKKQFRNYFMWQNTKTDGMMLNIRNRSSNSPDRLKKSVEQ